MADQQSLTDVLLGNSSSGCLLKNLLSSDRDPFHLNDAFRRRVEQLVADGISMFRTWPRGSSAAVESWLGERWYISHARNFRESANLATIVGSQIGRHGIKLPDWPRLLDSALRNIRFRDSTLLLSSKTTFFELASEYAQTAGVRTLLVDVASKSEDAGEWLFRCLDALESSGSSGKDQIFLSPPISQTALKVAPVQDRAVIAIADTVYALSIRPGGNVDRLIKNRLGDTRFTSGSVFAHVEPPGRTTQETDWLDLGAVGWYVPSPEQSMAADFSHCKRQNGTDPQDNVGTQQVCSHLPAAWSTGHGDDWHLLSHCTRANCGPLPEETEAQYRHRLWIAGHIGDNHPMTILHRICCERTLKGTSRITRTDQRCVSLSAVPLPELLNQREFHSHLGRWDWEPYGLIIDRDALESAGARPVIYGSEKDFTNLDLAMRPFFQPLGKKPNDWSREQEWRVLGDLDLSSLPPDSIRLFVRTQAQANQLSRRFPWPVLWVES